jgi:hypothetical protein
MYMLFSLINVKHGLDYLDFHDSTRFYSHTVNLSAVGLTTHLAFHPSPFPTVDDPLEA